MKKSDSHLIAEDHREIGWWYSIDLGDGVVTQGTKPPDVCRSEFDRLGLAAGALTGRRVLDIGCNEGYMSLRCEALGADVVAIDGVYRDGMKYVREHLKPRFRFRNIDFMSPLFLELGRFDVILYLGVLYHTVYPFEHLLRLANACKLGGLVFIETEFYDLPGNENEPTIIFNYDGRLTRDLSSPIIPSMKWLDQTLTRIGFSDVTILHKTNEKRGRVTLRAKYTSEHGDPILFAAEQN